MILRYILQLLFKSSGFWNIFGIFLLCFSDNNLLSSLEQSMSPGIRLTWILVPGVQFTRWACCFTPLHIRNYPKMWLYEIVTVIELIDLLSLSPQLWDGHNSTYLVGLFTTTQKFIWGLNAFKVSGILGSKLNSVTFRNKNVASSHSKFHWWNLHVSSELQ